MDTRQIADSCQHDDLLVVALLEETVVARLEFSSASVVFRRSSPHGPLRAAVMLEDGTRFLVLHHDLALPRGGVELRADALANEPGVLVDRFCEAFEVPKAQITWLAGG